MAIPTFLRRSGPKGPPQFVRAVHYFSDGWPLDWLQIVREPNLRRELRGIRDDGFNTVILVIPWRGFQTRRGGIAYDPFYQSQLSLVLKACRRCGLAVILRVAYTHQVLLGPSPNGTEFSQRLLTEEDLEFAWLDYHRELSAIASRSGACVSAFISWEELWHAFESWQTLDLDARRAMAESVGFSGYLGEQGVTDVHAIPEGPRDPAHAHWHRFVNARIRTMFTLVCEVYPDLGVEIRVDRDPLYGEDTVHWLENDRFLDPGLSRHTYWAPFMGAENRGETLDAPTALASFRYMLDYVTDDGQQCDQVVDQFNFIDATAKYASTHARIEPDAIPDFLQGCVSLLRSRSAGYGLWAYRDYRCNILYNSALLNRGRGWSLHDAGGVFRRRGGVKLSPGGLLSQQLKPRVVGVSLANPIASLTLQIECSGRSPQLRGRLNAGDWKDLEPDRTGRFSADVLVDFESIFAEGLYLELANAGGAVSVSRLYLFHNVYRGEIRDVDGEAGPYLEAIRRFNGELAEFDIG